MKLEDVKAKIDSFFDRVSEQELFDLLTQKYQMPVIYDIELPSLNQYGKDGDILVSTGHIEYESIQTGEWSTNEAVKVSSPQESYGYINTDDSCVTDLLSYAA